MRRYLPQTIAAILVAATLAWGQSFRGPDTRPRQHTPTSNPISIVISGAPLANQIWAWPLAPNLLFPANFAGSPLDGYPGVSCGTSVSESDTYSFKCAGVTIGQVVIGGPGTASLVNGQSAGNVCANAACTATLTGTPALGNILVAFVMIGSNSFATTVTDSLSNTLTNCGPVVFNGAANNITIAYEKVPSGVGKTLTVAQAGSNAISITAAEFTSTNGFASTILDSCNSPTGATGTSQSVSSGTVTNTNSNDLILVAGGVGSISFSVNSLTAGYTAVLNEIGDGQAELSAFQSVTSNASQNAVWAISASQPWGGVALALSINGGGSCTQTFTTTGGNPQFCAAGKRFEMDAPSPASGSNIGITIPAHTP